MTWSYIFVYSWYGLHYAKECFENTKIIFHSLSERSLVASVQCRTAEEGHCPWESVPHWTHLSLAVPFPSSATHLPACTHTWQPPASSSWHCACTGFTLRRIQTHSNPVHLHLLREKWWGCLCIFEGLLTCKVVLSLTGDSIAFIFLPLESNGGSV